MTLVRSSAGMLIGRVPTRFWAKFELRVSVPTSHILQCRLQRLFTPSTSQCGPCHRCVGKKRSFSLSSFSIIMRVRLLSDACVLNAERYRYDEKQQQEDFG